MKLNRIFFLMLIVVSASLYAAEPSVDGAMTGFQFLEEPISSELIGLANSGVASIGMGGFFYNPAKYSLVASPSFHLEFGRYKKADAKKVNFELSIPVKKAFISYGMRVFSIDDIGSVDQFGNLPQGTFSERGTKISLASGLEINEYFDIGVSVSGVIHNLYIDNAYALLFGFGVIGSPIPKKLNVGLSVVDLGVTTGMYAKKEKLGKGEKLPVNCRLGAVWMDTLKTIDYRVLFDIVYRNVWDRDDEFSHRISDRFSFPLGLEVRPISPLAIRAGKRINFPTEVINLGMGLNTSMMDFDFGLVVNKLVDDAEPEWTASFTYHLVKKKQVDDKPVQKSISAQESKEEKTEVKNSAVIQNTSADTSALDSGEDVLDTAQAEIKEENNEVIDILRDTTGEDPDTLVDTISNIKELEKGIPVQDEMKDADSDSSTVEIKEEEIILEKEDTVVDSTSEV